jgi:hypothetical protein
MIWGFIKLGMYAIAAYAFHSFEYIIYSMVAVHVFGGVCLMYLAYREYMRISRECADGTVSVAGSEDR